MTQALDALMGLSPVIPVLVIEEAAHAVPLARALAAGGVRALEVTLRTPAALDAIRAIARDVPEATVGAGTVLNARDLEAAAEAGARLIVRPGLTPQIAEAAAAARRGHGHRDHARARPRPDPLQVFPGRDLGRSGRCGGLRRAVRRRPVLSHRWDQRRQRRRLPGPAQRRLRGRQLARSARGGAGRRLATDRGPSPRGGGPSPRLGVEAHDRLGLHVLVEAEVGELATVA